MFMRFFRRFCLENRMDTALKDQKSFQREGVEGAQETLRLQILSSFASFIRVRFKTSAPPYIFWRSSLRCC
jgi:hypothetical protein